MRKRDDQRQEESVFGEAKLMCCGLEALARGDIYYIVFAYWKEGATAFLEEAMDAPTQLAS